METQVISLLRSRPLVTAGEVATLLQVSEEEVLTVFAAVANADAGAYALLGGTVEEAAVGTPAATTKVSMKKMNRADSTASTYALMALAYPAHVTASAAPIALRPSVGDTLRTYPVVSRATLENRPADTPRAATSAAGAAAAVAAGPPSLSPKPPQVVKPEGPAVKVEAAVAPTPTPLPTPVLPVLTATEVQSPVVPEPPQTAVQHEEMKSPAVAAPPRTPTIFDKMKAAAATKRSRDGDHAPAKAKKTTAAAKPKKAAKTENTTSLTKLARASRKKGGVAPQTTALSSRSFLDEDDGDAMNDSSNSDESTTHDASFVAAEVAPVLDVVEVTASNDEVVLCDGAPPLAFRPAEPVAAVSAVPAMKETAAKKAGTAAAAAAAESGAAQSTLGSFFNPAVVAFQKSYTREVQTEMKMEKGEYVCVDVPCYKHKGSGETISEAEYHQRTAQLVRSYNTAAESPTHSSAGELADAPPSPAAKPAPRSPGEKAEKTKASPAPGKTLLSFFKPAAS